MSAHFISWQFFLEPVPYLTDLSLDVEYRRFGSDFPQLIPLITSVWPTKQRLEDQNTAKP